MIPYIRHTDLDFVKWDERIRTSCYETVYAYSWYLDLAAGHWDALVMGDYHSVMPLVWKQKYLIKYITQPLNTQQLGIFSENPPDEKMIRLFLESIPAKFLRVDMSLNSSNYHITGIRDITLRSNFELKLESDYESLSEAYHTNTRRNIIKSQQSDYRIGEVAIEDFLTLKSIKDKVPVNSPRLIRTRKIIEGGMKHERINISGAWLGDELCGAILWVHSQTRSIYLLSVSTERGKEGRAMFGLVDQFIREHAGTGKILDFEGSNIPSIARFFSGFGAEPKEYYRLQSSLISKQSGRSG